MQGQPWKNLAAASRTGVAGSGPCGCKTCPACAAQAYTEQAGLKEDVSAPPADAAGKGEKRPAMFFAEFPSRDIGAYDIGEQASGGSFHNEAQYNRPHISNQKNQQQRMAHGSSVADDDAIVNRAGFFAPAPSIMYNSAVAG